MAVVFSPSTMATQQHGASVLLVQVSYQQIRREIRRDGTSGTATGWYDDGAFRVAIEPHRHIQRYARIRRRYVVVVRLLGISAPTSSWLIRPRRALTNIPPPLSPLRPFIPRYGYLRLSEFRVRTCAEGFLSAPSHYTSLRV